MTDLSPARRWLAAVALASSLALSTACGVGQGDGSTGASESSSADAGSDASSDAGADTGSDAGADSGTDAGAWTAGTYEATGDYTSPGGSQSVGVELTVDADGTVTDVTVTPEASDPTSERYQEQFAGGIADEVVGQSIDSLDVSVVAGSSLTSGGFDDAVQKIVDEARA